MAFGQVVDLVGQLALTPIINLLDIAAAIGHDPTETFNQSSPGIVCNIGIDNVHRFILIHGVSPPLGLPAPAGLAGTRIQC